MNTNDRVKAERALTDLSNLGFTCAKEGWRELTQRIETYERGTPTEQDLRLTLPVIPPAIASHFEGKANEVLSPSNMWKGYSYTLSPGQRRWFRDFTGLTPAQTVTISWIETWPGTMSPRAFKVVSDVHVDPRHRKHVLTEWVIRDVGAFFLKCEEFDAEEKIAKTLAIVPGKVNTWRGVHARAVKILTGRKVIGDAEDIVILDGVDENFVVKDFVGNEFLLNIDEFRATVTDLENGTLRSGGAADGDKAGSKVKTPPLSLDELIQQLESGILPL